MQISKISFLTFNRRHCSYLFTFSFLLFSFFSVNARPIEGAYLGLGVGYSQNTLRGATSQIVLNQGTGTIPFTLESANTEHASSLQQRLDAGYVWAISTHWSWSLGGRFNNGILNQLGKGQLEGQASEYSYQYQLSVKTLSAVVRLIAHTKYWQYYGELIAGESLLDSRGYDVTASSFRNRFSDNEISRPAYGVGGGVMVRVAANTSIGISADYMDLGTGRLGSYQVPSGTAVTGSSIQQPLRTITDTVNIVQWF